MAGRILIYIILISDNLQGEVKGHGWMPIDNATCYVNFRGRSLRSDWMPIEITSIYTLGKI